MFRLKWLFRFYFLMVLSLMYSMWSLKYTVEDFVIIIIQKMITFHHVFCYSFLFSSCKLQIPGCKIQFWWMCTELKILYVFLCFVSVCECGLASKGLCVCLLIGIQFHLPSSGSVDRPSQQPPGTDTTHLYDIAWNQHIHPSTRVHVQVPASK